MNWQLWTVVAMLALSAVATVNAVGEERKPTTSGVAALSVVISGTLIALVFVGASS